jgi:pyruvate-formate lyase-activating enzyme
MPGRSALLLLTDRCPVGCAHCSVDSRPDSATIDDLERFESVVAALCARPELTLVGISGGEPFVERRGLTLAVDRLARAGKQIALYTSGVWAAARVPAWTLEVVRQASCVVLSTDAFHTARIAEQRFVRAATTIAGQGVWLIVQVLDVPHMAEDARRLLDRAFGRQADQRAELHVVPALPYGRGASLFARGPGRRAGDFGTCQDLNAPVVRFDGVVSPCCNEQVITGGGPERLRRRCASGDEVTAALAAFDADPLLGAIGRLGAGPLTLLPRFSALAERRFSSICELCWALQERASPVGDSPDRLLGALALMARDRASA